MFSKIRFCQGVGPKPSGRFLASKDINWLIGFGVSCITLKIFDHCKCILILFISLVVLFFKFYVFPDVAVSGTASSRRQPSDREGSGGHKGHVHIGFQLRERPRRYRYIDLLATDAKTFSQS